MKTKLEKALSECPWYDFHTIDGNTLVVRYDHCGCGCDEQRSVIEFPIVEGEVIINNVKIKIEENDK